MEIKKPESVARQEFQQKLIDLINTSQLPPYVVESILGNALNEVQICVREQFQRDMKAYQAALNKEKEAKVEEEK